MKFGHWVYWAALLYFATVGPAWAGHGSNPDYPIYPDNIEEILQPDKKSICDAYSAPSKLSPSYLTTMKHIDETYKGGNNRDFFFKYVLTMNCWVFRDNFFDAMSKTGNVSQYIGTMMITPYGGVDPNAYIRIEREGKLFEGPIYYVFENLAKNYPNSKRAGEYVAVMRRLNAPARKGLLKNGYAVDVSDLIKNSGVRRNASPSGYYLLYPVKSLEQIRRDDPAMLIRLP